MDQYLSQYGSEKVGLVIHKNGVVVDADDDDVKVRMQTLDDPPSTIFVDRAATRVELGTYEVQLTGVDTQVPGRYQIYFEYEVDDIEDLFGAFVIVGEADAGYDTMTPEMQAVVDQVWGRFSDLFDSPYGGPHLQVYFQTNWSRGRMAQVVSHTISSINATVASGINYTAYPPNEFPLNDWGGFLALASFREAVKHLIVSYTEIPAAPNVGVPYLDRRDYMQRWKEVLDMEKEDFEDAKDAFVMSTFGLGRPRVLVAGGVFGNFGYPRLATAATAARPRYWSAFI